MKAVSVGLSPALPSMLLFQFQFHSPDCSCHTVYKLTSNLNRSSNYLEIWGGGTVFHPHTHTHTHTHTLNLDNTEDTLRYLAPLATITTLVRESGQANRESEVISLSAFWLILHLP